LTNFTAYKKEKLCHNIGTTFLNLARTHEESRVPQNGTNVPTYHYTEWWFRNRLTFQIIPQHCGKLSIKDFPRIGDIKNIRMSSFKYMS
jgi:hypothetical protein